MNHMCVRCNMTVQAVWSDERVQWVARCHGEELTFAISPPPFLWVPTRERRNYNDEVMRDYYAQASREAEKAFEACKALVIRYIHRHPMAGGLDKAIGSIHRLFQQELMRQDEDEKREARRNP